MKKSFREDRKGTFIVASGWLFADMLLALAMLFLVSSTIGIHPPPPAPPPTRTPVLDPHLEQTFHRFIIDVDPNGLFNGNQDSMNAVIQQITAQPFLRGKRRAGLAIVYGGAPDDTQISIADTIANEVYAILQNMGKNNAQFANIAKYDPLYLLGGVPNKVTIDIFLFAQ